MQQLLFLIVLTALTDNNVKAEYLRNKSKDVSKERALRSINMPSALKSVTETFSDLMVDLEDEAEYLLFGADDSSEYYDEERSSFDEYSDGEEEDRGYSGDEYDKDGFYLAALDDEFVQKLESLNDEEFDAVMDILFYPENRIPDGNEDYYSYDEEENGDYDFDSFSEDEEEDFGEDLLDEFENSLQNKIESSIDYENNALENVSEESSTSPVLISTFRV